MEGRVVAEGGVRWQAGADWKLELSAKAQAVVSFKASSKCPVHYLLPPPR